jgi:hypothetical protein
MGLVLGQAGKSREATPFGTQGQKVAAALSRSTQFSFAAGAAEGL